MKLPRGATTNLDPSDEKLLHDVENHGWHVILVPDEYTAPGWAFSVGLYYTFQHPEVIVFGLPSEVKHSMINTIGDNVRAGTVYKSGVEVTDVLTGGISCLFQAVEKRWYESLLGYGKWFYENDSFPVLQCFWPDKQGKYPWDSNFSPALFWKQPLLFHTDPVKARVERPK